MASQYADERAVSRGDILEISEDNILVGVSGWSGECKIYGLPDCEIRTTLEGHTNRTNHIRFHPEAGKSLSADTANIATASADFTVRLWTMNPELEK